MTHVPDGEQRCHIYWLKEGAGEAYDRWHAAVWPEMISVLQESGIYDYSIFRRGRLVISTYRTDPDHRPSAPSAHASAVQARWTASLAELFDSVADADGEPLWAERVFRLPTNAIEPKRQPNPEHELTRSRRQ